MAKYCSFVLTVIVLFAAISAFAGVNLTSPAPGATVTSPVTFIATATSGCPQGVASMGIYTAPYVLAYTVNGASLNTQLSLGAGSYTATVVAWDFCGGATTAAVTFTVTNQAGVNVSSPVNNSTVPTSVHFVASATSTCAKGVASMGIYTAPYTLAYVSNGSSLDATLTLSPGTYNTVVQAWDYCGGSTGTPVKITVGGNVFTNLQNNTGWQGWGELPPIYDICAYPCPGVLWGLDHGISSPSLSGSSARFSLGGTTPYSDALWNNHLIGDGSTQGMLDSAHVLVPKYSSFTYDLYFYTADFNVAQSIEFDIAQYFNNMGFLWGTECRIQQGRVWAVWNNVANRWDATSIPCNPINNSWNHLTIEVQRTWDNWLWYKTITLNGTTYQLNWYYPPSNSPGWYGVVINFQLDGNYKQTPYSVYLDKVTLSYN